MNDDGKKMCIVSNGFINNKSLTFNRPDENNATTMKSARSRARRNEIEEVFERCTIAFE